MTAVSYKYFFGILSALLMGKNTLTTQNQKAHHNKGDSHERKTNLDSSMQRSCHQPHKQYSSPGLIGRNQQGLRKRPPDPALPRLLRTGSGCPVHPGHHNALRHDQRRRKQQGKRNRIRKAQLTK